MEWKAATECNAAKREVSLECSTWKLLEPAKSYCEVKGMGQKVTVEEIQMAVKQFWDVFRAKSEERLRELYSHNSTSFEVAGVRNEPGKLGAARRAREYFHPEALFDVQIGPVDVVLLGDEAAVSSYT